MEAAGGCRGEDRFVDDSTSGDGPTTPFASPFQCFDEEAVEFSMAPAGRKAMARMRRWERAMECVLPRWHRVPTIIFDFAATGSC